MSTGRRRFLFFAHDAAQPSGGVRTIYELVSLLNRNGFSAFVVHGERGFRADWLNLNVPTIYHDGRVPLQPGDVLVIPEDLEALSQLKGAPVEKIVFCQNHFCAFSGLPAGESWRSLGVTRVLASSQVIAGFVGKELGWPEVSIVHYAINGQIFKPAKKKLQIACMPRKLRLEAKFIRGLFGATGGAASQFQWVEIDGMRRDRVATILAESAIFVSLSWLEGLGLPPLEAMASGCAVVGFHGYGGLEFARPDNGFWCQEGNPLDCVAFLRIVAEKMLRGDAGVRKVIDAGIETAAGYTSKRQEEEIVAFAKEVLAEPGGISR